MNPIERNSENQISRRVIDKAVPGVLRVGVSTDAEHTMEEVIGAQPKPEASVVFNSITGDIVNGLLPDGDRAEQIQGEFVRVKQPVGRIAMVSVIGAIATVVFFVVRAGRRNGEREHSNDPKLNG